MFRVAYLFLFCFGATAFANAQENTDSLKLVLSVSEGTAKVQTLNALCYAYAYVQADSARAYGIQALALQNEAGYTELLAETLHNLAITHQVQSNYTVALGYDERSLQISTRLGDTLQMANTINNMALIYDEQGRYKEAIEHYLLAYDLYESHNAKDKLAIVNVNLGVVYKAIGDFEKSENNYRLALNYFIERKQNYPAAVCYVNIGSVFLANHQYDSALKHSLLAEKMFRELNYVRFEAVAMGNAGIAYGKLNQKTKAEQYLAQAITLHKKNNNQKELAFCYLKQAEFYRDQTRLSDALTSALQALHISTQAGALQQIADVNQLLADVYRRQNNYTKAFEAQSHYIAVHDSLFEQNKIREVRQLQTQFETEKKERELAESKVALAESELQIKERNNQLVLAAIGLAIILLFVIFFYRNQKIKQQRLQLKAELAEAKTRNALQEERLRISQELHDNIGSQLTFVKTSLASVNHTSSGEQLLDLQRITTGTIRELRKTVWLINRDSASVEEFIIKLREYIPDISKPAIKITASGNQRAIITSNKANDLFRFVQEATNNAIKHANASLIEIIVTINEVGTLSLRVTDNGNGFNTQLTSSGFGLRSMDKRIASLGGTFSLHSEPGSTAVIASGIPL